MATGWYNKGNKGESYRHSLAAKGIKSKSVNIPLPKNLLAEKGREWVYYSIPKISSVESGNASVIDTVSDNIYCSQKDIEFVGEDRGRYIYRVKKKVSDKGRFIDAVSSEFGIPDVDIKIIEQVPSGL
jgi:hypothetical protein